MNNFFLFSPYLSIHNMRTAHSYAHIVYNVSSLEKKIKKKLGGKSIVSN